MKWLRKDVVIAIHKMQIAEHGGSGGIRDERLLESALDRPKQYYHYSNCGIPELGAVYALSIIENHPFIDGNKRTGFIAMQVFLSLHDYSLKADDINKYMIIMGLASGDLSKEAMIAWVKKHV